MSKYSEQDIKSDIEAARNSETAVVFKNIAPDVPSWDDFIQLIDREIHTPQHSYNPNSPFEERVINGVTIRNLFYLMVTVSSQGELKSLGTISDIFSKVLEASITPVGAFINIIGGEPAGEPHRDDRETLYWQCQGTAKWFLYENPGDGHYDTKNLKVIKELRLEPGDVIFVKKRAMHSVQNFGPRAAIAFMPLYQDN